MTTSATDNTLAYYAENAEAFAASTVDVDLSATQRHFAALLPAGGRVLDLGCGSGRDSRAFLDMGFRVTATDGSPEMCVIAEQTAGIPVRNELFQDLDDDEAYDGVWACSSILHLPRVQLADVLLRIERALVPGGVLYASFKHGERDDMQDGRHFTDFTESSLREFVKTSCGLVVEETWLTHDARPEKRRRSPWLNTLIRRPDLTFPATYTLPI